MDKTPWTHPKGSRLVRAIHDQNSRATARDLLLYMRASDAVHVHSVIRYNPQELRGVATPIPNAHEAKAEIQKRTSPVHIRKTTR